MRLALALAFLAALAAGCGSGSKAKEIPRGLRLEAAAAVGTRDYWVLGEYRCSRGWCLALVRSTDAGKHFSRVAAPPLLTQGLVPRLEFANARVGYAFVRGSPLYATHDGGLSWRSSGRGGVTDVAVAGRRIYAVFAANRFERSSVSESSWRQVALPVRLRFLVSLAARGRNVWILGSSTHVLAGDAVLRSTDRGTTFERRRGPCVPELGGTLVPAGHGVVWAVCPTGMMAGLWLSRNGGRSFPTIRSFHGPGWVSRPPLTNGAQIFPLSTRAALLYAGGQGQLFQTSDLGVRWTRSMTARLDQLLWLGFATSRVGAALVTTRSRPNRALLWRTTDGGASWHVVPLR